MTQPSLQLNLPNQAGAVINVIPNLCGILASFAGAYFIAITLTTDNSFLNGSLDFAYFNTDEIISRKAYIQVLSVISLFLLIISSLYAVRTNALHYSKETYPFDETPEDSYLKEWRKNKVTAMARSYMYFNSAFPVLLLAITALMDGYFLAAITVVLYVYIGILIFNIVTDKSKEMVIEHVDAQ